MSLVYITQHDENIYELGRKKAADIVRPPKYISKFRATLRKDVAHEKLEATLPKGTKILTSSVKASHKTMGYAKTPLNHPENFLRKHEGVKFAKPKDHECVKIDIPPIPPRQEYPCRREEKINFIAVNARKAVCSGTKRPTPRYAVSKNGDLVRLCNAGIMPAYIFMPTYGKVPKYITQFKNMMAEKKTQVEAKQKEKQSRIKFITQEERQKLLDGLKANWQELQKSFQILPVLTDTGPKKKRKNDLEKDIRQIERDILLIESNPLIYVCGEERSGS